MTIKTFNSGRQYTAHGQRIAYLQLAIVGHGKVLTAMVDIDRQIDYMLVVDYPFGEAELLAAYDNRTFSTEVDGSRLHMQDGLKEMLSQAAANHGKTPTTVLEQALAALDALPKTGGHAYPTSEQVRAEGMVIRAARALAADTKIVEG